MSSRQPSRRAKPKGTATDVPNESQQDDSAKKFPIVGIAASAGGLEAFTELLKYLSPTTGMAFVLIQHLVPDHKSWLAEILADKTQMPVCQVEEGMRVAPNQVYVIPPNRKMIIASGRLQLSPRVTTRGKHHPATSFFESLAADRGKNAIAIVLTGMDGDGAVGLEPIKAAGGITFAQTEISAKYKGMPQSAAETGYVDFILSPKEIAETLNRLPFPAETTPSFETKIVEVASSNQRDEEAYSLIFQLLLSATGVDFNGYKEATINRRIDRQMIAHKIVKVEEYASLLQSNTDEVQALYQDLLIHVTSFFRDAGAFEALKGQVFPQIVQNIAPDAAIRIWVAGCSTGDEAYSIAICLLEFLDTPENAPHIQIFATDVSETAIAQARSGIYLPHQVAQVSPERLQRFFVPLEEGYQISQSVRKLCIFARHNLSSDPPFSNLDLISCRNVLIYLDAAVQKRVLPNFHYGLKPSGFLMLGTSESPSEFSDLFAVLDKKYKIYARKLAPVRLNWDFAASTSRKATLQLGKQVSEDTWSSLELYKEADRIVLHQYAPVGVVINNNLEILQFRGETSAYLIPAAGQASLNLIKMARQGLIVNLRTAIQQAKKSNRSVKREGVRMSIDGRSRQVNLEVVPLSGNQAGERFFLVLFEDFRQPFVADASAIAINETPSLKPPTTAQIAEIAQLKQELAIAKDELLISQEYLQSIVQEQEATNEDFAIANEELLSSNEELQSLNQEMETAKEEIHATNEELHTVNAALQSRNQEANQLNNDLTNLFSSVNIPILFLGSSLNIRHFTPQAETLFNLIPTDVGRSLTHIKPNINVPDLETLILEVIHTNSIREQEVQDRDGHWYVLRIRPYRTEDDRNQKINGAVVTLVDVDELKRSAAKLKASLDYVGSIVETVREPLVVLEPDLRVKTANRAFYQTFRLAPEQAEQHSIFELGNGQWNIPRLRLLLEEILPRDHQLNNFEVEQVFDQIGSKTMLLNACKMPPLGNVQMILLAMEDITERKLIETGLRNLNITLEHQVQKRTTQLQQALDIEGGVNRIINKMHDSLDEDQILQTAVEELALMLGVKCCKVSVYGREQLTSTICYAYATHTGLDRKRIIKLDDFPATDQPLLQYETLQFCSVIPDPVLGRVAMLICAIWDEKQVLGDLWIINQEEYIFTEQDIHVVQQVANQCAIALRQAYLYRAAQLQVEELKKLDLLKDDFLNTVSHELRTPLANIKMATQMLEIILKQTDIFHDKSNRAFQYLQILHDECWREISLINDLLDSARLDAETEPLTATTMELQTWIPHIAESFEERILSQQQSLQIHIPAELPALKTDFDDLERILSELLHNACKYTPPGEQITVSAAATNEGMQLKVSNSGVEIAAGECDRVFDKFYRIPNSDRWKHGGTGLGLALVKKRVERLGGTIQATSDAGHTTFTVKLPQSLSQLG